MFKLIGRWLTRGFQDVATLASALSQVAQLETALMLAAQLEQMHPDLSRDRRYQLAAARANYLYGKTPPAQHAHLDLPAEQRAARAWLESAGREVRELVIQGLRINRRIGVTGGRHDPGPGQDLLDSHGPEFPERPDLRHYDQVVTRVLQRLGADQRASLVRFVLQGPFAAYLTKTRLGAVAAHQLARRRKPGQESQVWTLVRPLQPPTQK